MVYAIGFRISLLPIRYYCNNIHETETESIENYKKYFELEKDDVTKSAIMNKINELETLNITGK